MKIKKTLLAAIVAAGVSVAGVSAHAEPGNGFNGNGFGPGIPGAGLNALDGIDLTKKQRKQIQTILQEAHRQDQTQDLRGDFDKIHRQIEDALTSPGPVDKDKVATLQQEMATLRAQRESQHLETASRIHDVLTADQLAQIHARQVKIHDLLDQLHAVEHPAPTADADKSGK